MVTPVTALFKIPAILWKACSPIPAKIEDCPSSTGDDATPHCAPTSSNLAPDELGDAQVKRRAGREYNDDSP